MPSLPSAPPSIARSGPRALLRHWRRKLVGIGLAAGFLAGCASFDAQQREWIFQPSKETWSTGPVASARVKEVWIDFLSRKADGPARLHGFWIPQASADAPVLLYLHGARWDVRGSLARMQRMHDLGFAVLGVDYRGFGQSTDLLPSETSSAEDAHAAWDWLKQEHPAAKRYVFGHSLGGAIAIQLASEVDDAAGLIVENTFTSIPDVFQTFKWGWLPVSGLITQRFDSVSRIARVKAPVLVVHGSEDQLIPPRLGESLYEHATGRKRFLLVEGGSHHSTNTLAQDQYREALSELFGIHAEVAVGTL